MPILSILFGPLGRVLMALLAIGLVAFGIWSYINITQNKIQHLTSENAQLKVQVEQYRKAVVELQGNFDKYRVALDEMLNSMIEAGIPEERIIEFFRKNDFSKMSADQVQVLLNQQQVDIKNCLEILTGKAKTGKANDLCPNF